jgi:UbiD family decarboxylase
MLAKALSPHAQLPYRDLRGYIKLLEGAGLLKRIKVEVDLKHEIGAICVKSMKSLGPALLFENIRGYKGMPLIANILSTPQQLALAFDTAAEDLAITEAIQTRKSNPIPPRLVRQAPCQEEIFLNDEVDVYKFPTPWWHELDGGQYIGTTAGVITADPDNGNINMGMYRVMIKDRRTLALNIKGPHPIGKKPRDFQGVPNGATHILKNEAAGKGTPVAVALGMDPPLTFMAAHHAGDKRSKHGEYAWAGGLRGEPVELINCKTNDLLVPANSEIILEGEVVAHARISEGPHGESQGFYGQNDQAFLIRIGCMTHRKNPISYGLICGCREDYPKYIKYSGLQAALKAVSCVKEVYEPDLSGGRCRIVIISANVQGPADVNEIIRALKRIPSNSRTVFKPRWAIIVDADCDCRDWEDVMWRLAP